MFDFTGKTILVTGASRGIGAEAAYLYAKFGGKVVINFSRREDKATEVQDRIAAIGGKSELFKANVSSKGECQAMIDFTVEKFGSIDILVNNAGIWKEAAIESMTEKQLSEMIDINLNGCFYTTSAAVPHMKKQQSGNIVFVASTAGQRGEAYHSHYAASKGALISLTKSLAPELASDNIMVNCVAPGWVDTDMSHNLLVSEEASKYVSLIPIGRAASAEEIAYPILFISSKYASFITGEILNVNGGAVLVG